MVRRAQGLTKQRREMEKLWLAWRLPIILATVLVVAILGGGYLYQEHIETKASEHQAAIANNAQTAADRFRQGVEQERSSLAALLNEDELTALLKKGDKRAIAQMEERLTNSSKQVLRARLVKRGSTRTDYNTTPPLTYAAIALLRESESQEKAPPAEVHLFGEEGQHVIMLWRLSDGDTLVGHLVVALDVGVLPEIMARASVPKGYAEIVQQVQGAKPIVLADTGSGAARVGPPSLSVNIAGLPWRLVYWSGDAPIEAEPWMQPPVLAGGAAGVVIFISAIFALLRRRKPEEAPEPVTHRVRKGAPANVNPMREALGANGDVEPSPTSSVIEVEEVEDGAGPGRIAVEPKVEIPASIFRAYDVRGVVEDGLGPDAVKLIGRAIGSEAYDRGQQTLVVGYDGRSSSPELSDALIEGLRESGRDVINIGRVPTPVLYFATNFLNTGSGVMVTGSHNPPEYNGLKTMLGGDTLFGDDIQALRQRIIGSNFTDGSGSVQSMEMVDEYIRRVCEDIPVALGNSFKIVIDCGNGVAGDVAPKLMRALGHEVVDLYCEVDGSFPNHHPDPSQPANLQDLITTVQDQSADLGFAFDGDGDRLGVVDGAGTIIWPDRQMMLYAKDVLSRHPGADIIFDVKCTGRLAKVIKQLGGKPVMWKTGHSFIKNKLKETGAPLAGEMSGHIFFKDRWYGFDDAIYTASRLLQIMVGFKHSPGKIFGRLPQGVSTPELRIDMQEGEHSKFMEALMKGDHFSDGKRTTIDGLRVDYADGWGLVRASNTTPSLVVRFEGDDKEALSRIQEEFRGVLLGVDSNLRLPF